MLTAKSRIQQLVEAARKSQAEIIAKKLAQTLTEEDKKVIVESPVKEEHKETPQNTQELIDNARVEIKASQGSGDSWQWHERQLMAMSLAEEGESFCLIGAAGTGKTTTVKEIVARLMTSGHIGKLSANTKFLKADSPSIVFCAYTRRAVNNLKKNLPDYLKGNCITFHKLLEFEPVEVYDVEGNKTMRFLPQRNKNNPLPHIDFIVMEEGSMTGIDLYNQVIEATDKQSKEIHIGDLNQLKPVFGDAILGYKLNQLKVVELTHVYRQALESPIISFAHKILEGKPLNEEDLSRLAEEPYLNFLPYKKPIEGNMALRVVKQKFTDLIKSGEYDIENSIVLCPFNKSFGCIEINKAMAQADGEVRGAIVHEIIAGFETVYFAEGDRVLYRKDAGTIIEIRRNGSYTGRPYRLASTTLSRDGVDSKPSGFIEAEHSFDDIMEQGFFDEEVTEESQDGRKFQASHIVTIALENGDVVRVSSASGFNNDVEFGYAMTVHKAQGSQWRNVYLVMHRDHNIMINRELLYTAVTRAEIYLTIIYTKETRKNVKDGTFGGGIKRQAIKGRTLEDKIAYFSGKMDKLNTNKSSSVSFFAASKPDLLTSRAEEKIIECDEWGEIKDDNYPLDF